MMPIPLPVANLSVRALALCLAGAISAQSPLTTTYASNNGGLTGGMVFFDLDVTNPAGITIKELDCNTSSMAGELFVFTAPQSYTTIAGGPAAWTLGAQGTIDAAGPGQPTRVCLGDGFHLPVGTHAIALWGEEIDHRYTNGFGFQLVYANADVALTAGAATNSLWGGAQFVPRVFNGSIYYDVGATTGFSCAHTESIGVGCSEGATTWYERFADLSSFDLAGTLASPNSWRAVNAGATGYVVLSATAPWQVPSTTVLNDNNAANPGSLGPNEFSEPLQLPFAFPFPGGSTNVVHASANGWILLEPTTSLSNFTPPSASALLSDAARLCPLWCPMDPTANLASNPASGVYFEVDGGNQFATITWLDVADARIGIPAAGTTSVNVQCVLYATGDYEFRYGPVLPASGPGTVLAGWSRGGSAGPIPDPGSVDVSTGLPILTTGPDNFALSHRAGLAQLGASLDLSVRHVESVAPTAFLFVGDVVAAPPVDLTMLGAPDCFAYTNIVVSTSVPVGGPDGSGSFALPIPNNVALIGSTLVSQFAALTLRNALMVSTSDAARFAVGN